MVYIRYNGINNTDIGIIMNDNKQNSENTRAENTAVRPAAEDGKKKVISMAMKVDEGIANEFRKMAKETGMEQGNLLNAMIENYRLNEDRILYKEHADDIQLMRDLTATINYKYLALIAQNKVEAERIRAKDAKRIEKLEKDKQNLLEDRENWKGSVERNTQLEHEVIELKDQIRKLETMIDQLTTSHKNEIDALNNKHNADMTAMAQEYAQKYMKFVEDTTSGKTK